VGLIGPEVRERIKVDREVWSKVLAAANLRLDWRSASSPPLQWPPCRGAKPWNVRTKDDWQSR